MTARDSASLPDFVPVPRKIMRHDGWSPARQRDFIAALADTGSVPTACRMVNMAKSRAYALRREPGAEGFRRAWDAALDLGLQVLKDEAFDRALNGQLVPLFVGGKLIGYQRKKNDALLMFLLRHYGVDATGRRVTINYFSSKASAGASAGASTGADAGTSDGGAVAAETMAAGETVAGETTAGGSVRVPLCPARRAHGGRRGTAPALAVAPRPTPLATTTAAQAETSHTTMRTVISGPAAGDPGLRDDEAAAAIAAFEGVEIDDEAQAAILAALEACAARARTLPVEEDGETAFIGLDEVEGAFVGTLERYAEPDDDGDRAPGEVHWQMLDDHAALDAIDAAVARVEAAKAGTPLPPLPAPPWTPARALRQVEQAAGALAQTPQPTNAPLRPDIAEMLRVQLCLGGPTALERARASSAAERVLRAAISDETEDALAICQAAGTEERWAAWLKTTQAGTATPAAVPAVVPAVRLGDDGRLLSEAELLAKGDLLVPQGAGGTGRQARRAKDGRHRRTRPA